MWLSANKVFGGLCGASRIDEINEMSSWSALEIPSAGSWAYGELVATRSERAAPKREVKGTQMGWAWFAGQ